jgi:hypothetical protein
MLFRRFLPLRARPSRCSLKVCSHGMNSLHGLFWQLLQRPTSSHAVSNRIETTDSLPTTEIDSISSTVLSTQDHRIDDVYREVLTNPIPSPPIPNFGLGEASHLLDLRYAVSFSAFLELSDNELCQSNPSMSNLGSLITDLSSIDEPESGKAGPKQEKIFARCRYVLWPYDRVACFVRRLLRKSSPGSLVYCEIDSPSCWRNVTTEWQNEAIAKYFSLLNPGARFTPIPWSLLHSERYRPIQSLRDPNVGSNGWFNWWVSI